MALVYDNSFPADLGTLAADTVFTCERGMVGLTTDTDGSDPEDCYKLSAGQRLVLASGSAVVAVRLAGPALLHHMPV